MDVNPRNIKSFMSSVNELLLIQLHFFKSVNAVKKQSIIV